MRTAPLLFALALVGCQSFPDLAPGDAIVGEASRESEAADVVSDTYVLPLAAGDTVAVRAGSDAFASLLVVNSSDGGTTQAASAERGETACLALTADSAVELMVRVAPTDLAPVSGEYRLRVDDASAAASCPVHQM